MGAQWIRPWAGGRVRDVDGRQVWVIERMAGGRRYAIRLDVHSERDALAEFALFERDPAGYRTRAQSVGLDPGAVRLDEVTLEAFGRDAERQGLTEAYRTQILSKYLAEWGAAIGMRRDLRTVPLGELQTLLDKWATARHHRIVALKSFTSWLRESGRLRRAEDPTLDLKVPQARPEKSVRAKGYTMQQVERTYAEVSSQVLRDTICLRAKTGMHDTEIGRIASGEAEIRRLNDPSGIAGTVRFAHLKAGKSHTVSVDAQTLAAAERLQARRSQLTRAPALLMLKRAHRRLAGDACTCGVDFANECKAQPPILRPSELRHSFATWARGQGREVRPAEGGVPLHAIAAVLGHATDRTTSAFYDGTEVPPMITVPIRLIHPEDPVPLANASRSAAAT